MVKIKTLFLAANPVGTDPLKLDEEIRAINEKITASEYRDSLELVSNWAVRPDDLLQALNTHKPQIVHFSGHGSSTGEITLVDNNGQPKKISQKAIKSLFTTLRDNIKVVVLNACYSKLQAEAITEIIDCTIGMNTAIGDKAAIVFAASFYRAIGFGRSVQEAFDQGKTALLLEDIPEENTPELLVRTGVDPSRIFLIKTTTMVRADRYEISKPKLIIDKISNFEEVKGNIKTIYSTAGKIDNTPVYGRGQHLLVTLHNQANEILDVVSVKLRLLSRDINHSPTLKYDKLQMSMPHTRLPIEAIKAPVQWSDSDSPGTLKEIGQGRIRLGPRGTENDIHQISFTVETRAIGLWAYQIEVEYVNPETGQLANVINENKLIILLRGI